MRMIHRMSTRLPSLQKSGIDVGDLRAGTTRNAWDGYSGVRIGKPVATSRRPARS
jgi:hypothetical protein